MSGHPEPTVRLTQDDVDFYHREGYLVVERIMPPEEVARLVTIYDRLFERQVGRENGDFFDLGGIDDGGPVALPQLMTPSRYAPGIEQGVFRANAETIARQLLGERCRFRQDLAIRKPPRSPAETPWHQDEAYLDPGFEYCSLNIWIPLQPASLDNGCMQFIPRSHASPEILPHHRIGDDPRIEGLECDDVDRSKAVACPLEPGGATLHHVRTLHHAGPNRSDEPRRAYILEFHAPPVRRAVARRYPWNEQRRTSRIASYSSLSAIARNKLYRVTDRLWRMFGRKK